ncbi:MULTISPECIES: CidA/LrgA family protein [Myroides]|uniref:CidA/LrgA family protein n=1 Tax=Myroides albus TaxID=2562892 RepID=A0A6I3LN18_9FLAO|nr:MULTISPECIES: CidA/LrgA family protein [Myroides]MTG97385.1 CidA/LrgA family protein [Myroides albus]MVX35119.1 CidA/LrgA family protein [Myroides sp. LoEW2-1]UVD79414.1 CidA/LrgA family protein [Myroides albus]
MNLIKQVAIIIGCLAFGELLIYLTGIKLPSSIIGLILLWTLLKIGWVKVESISGFTDFLIKNMGIFFVPPCVAMLNYFGILSESIIPIIIATLVSTALVIFVTGLSHQFLRRKR